MPIYTTPQSVSITIANPPGATIYYTTDGSTPTTSSTVYNPTTPLYIAVTTTIKAFGTSPGYIDSEVATVLIEITELQVYFGYSPLTDIPDANISSIGNSPLSNTIVQDHSAGSYNFGSGSTSSDYFYFWWPDTFNNPSVFTGFALGPFGVAMAVPAQGFTSGPVNGWYYKPKTVDGILGKLFRTYNKIGNGTTLTIVVTAP